MKIRIGNAPISWGVCEIPGWGPRLPYERVLDEIRAAGYEGTELGPWEFLPTDPRHLTEALGGLAMAAAFVGLELRKPEAYEDCENRVRETAQLLQRLGAQHILLADAGDARRFEVAGRPNLTREHGLTPQEWPGYVERLERLARMCLSEYGLVPCFHPHGGTYIENVDEIGRLLAGTDPELIWLCLDTGHVAFGGGDPVGVAREHAARLGYLHLKDIDLTRLRALLREGRDHVSAAKQDVFVELGRGSLDLTALLEVLKASGYTGWIVVEQDRVVQEDADTLGSARRSREYLRQALGV